MFFSSFRLRSFFSLSRRFATSPVGETESEIRVANRFLKKNLGKKDLGRIKAKLAKLTFTQKIQSAQQQHQESPNVLSKNKQFLQVPVDQKILDYITKHKLFKCREDFKINPFVNRFVSSVFKTQNVRIRVCKSSDRYPAYTPGEKHVEIALFGRSNVGKSSVLRALVPDIRLSQAPSISDRPGQTKSLHFIQLETLTLVDMPGYGFAFAKDSDSEHWKQFTEEFLTERTKVKRVCILLDARHGIKPGDHYVFELLERAKKKFQIIFTKVDTVEAEDLARRYKLVKEEMDQKRYKYFIDRILMVSSITKAGIPILQKELASFAYTGPRPMPRKALPPPTSARYEPLKGRSRYPRDPNNPGITKPKPKPIFLKRGRAKLKKLERE